MVEARVILVAPEGAQNLGLCARLCANFGVPALDLVRPLCDPTGFEAMKYATGGSDEVLRRARVHETLAAAVADRELVVGFCGKDVSEPAPPWIELSEVIERARSLKVALVFGNERTGLERPEVDLCQRVCRIPTAGLDSLNLSHAVAIVLSRVSEAGVKPESRRKDLATFAEIEAMLEHGRELLVAIGLNRAGNPDRFLASFRRVFDRAGLRPNEVRSLRSVFSKALRALGRN